MNQTASQDKAAPDYLIRALERGLEILSVLNQHSGLNIIELTQLVDMPRPTIYRLLKTLSDADYVVRSPADDKFRLTSKVRELSSGYESESWITDIAAPIAYELQEKLVWPISLFTMRQGRMIASLVTDHSCPLIVQRLVAGTTIPLCGSAAGAIFLAFTSGDTAKALRQYTLLSEEPLLTAQGLDIDTIDARIEETREKGYAYAEWSDMAAVSVPVRIKSELVAALSVRRYKEPAWHEAEIQTYASLLSQAAQDIGKRLPVSA